MKTCCNSRGTNIYFRVIPIHKKLVIKDFITIKHQEVDAFNLTLVWEIPCKACDGFELYPIPFTEILDGLTKDLGVEVYDYW